MVRLRRSELTRLMRYYRLLSGLPDTDFSMFITSAQIGNALDVDPTQVRRDFKAVNLTGKGRIGFRRREVCDVLRLVLRFDETDDAVLVGAGHLGAALMAYTGFADFGFRIVAAFDNDQRKVGREVAGHIVKSARSITPFLKKHDTKLAVLTTPGDVSQTVTDHLVSAGICGIWNFSSCQLEVPKHVLVRDARISLGISELKYHLMKKPGAWLE